MYRDLHTEPYHTVQYNEIYHYWVHDWTEYVIYISGQCSTQDILLLCNTVQYDII